MYKPNLNVSKDFRVPVQIRENVTMYDLVREGSIFIQKLFLEHGVDLWIISGIGSVTKVRVWSTDKWLWYIPISLFNTVVIIFERFKRRSNILRKIRNYSCVFFLKFCCTDIIPYCDHYFWQFTVQKEPVWLGVIEYDTKSPRIRTPPYA